MLFYKLFGSYGSRYFLKMLFFLRYLANTDLDIFTSFSAFTTYFHQIDQSFILFLFSYLANTGVDIFKKKIMFFSCYLLITRISTFSKKCCFFFAIWLTREVAYKGLEKVCKKLMTTSKNPATKILRTA